MLGAWGSAVPAYIVHWRHETRTDGFGAMSDRALVWYITVITLLGVPFMGGTEGAIHAVSWLIVMGAVLCHFWHSAGRAEGYHAGIEKGQDDTRVYFATRGRSEVVGRDLALAELHRDNSPEAMDRFKLMLKHQQLCRERD